MPTFSSDQLLEFLVVLCTAHHYRYDLNSFRSSSAHAESKSGPVQSASMPTLLHRVITPLQALSYFLFPTVYIFAVLNDRFQQPPWMEPFALPEAVYGVRMDGMRKNAVRVLACVATVALQRFSDEAFEHLGDQFHPIGRREKEKVVQTGPYAWIRHPLYVWILSQEALFSLMFWSYVPLFAVVATATVLVVKIRIEEEAIQQNETIREEYRAYMQKVPARLVPHVW